MTREDAKDLLPIIQAFVKGKTIEFRERGCTLWTESISPIFNFAIFEYRIKPKPKYRPFNDAEECWQEMKTHEPFGWLKDKKTKEYELLRRVAPKDGVIDQYTCVYERCVFSDGTPFGIKEE